MDVKVQRRSTRRLRAASPAAARAVAAPMTSLLPSVDGSSRQQLVDLQRTVGNRAVTALVAAYDGNGHTPPIRLHGRTFGTFDGGSSSVQQQRVRRATGCDCPAEDPCLRATGSLAIGYHVDVTIEMPPMPDGLSQCQQRRVRTFLRDVLGPHEQEHARRLRTYNGTTRRPFDVTGCGRSGLDTAVTTKLQQMHDDEADARAKTADQLSLAIDPFERDIDLDC
ncbi:MAG TPA: hypothetical protein VH419_04755 [Nocardioidaceae bacterium]